MTLALLLTAVTGAWAQTDPNAVYWTNEIWAGWAENVTTHTVGDITITCSGNAKAYESTMSGEPLALQAGNNDAITFTSNGKPFASVAITTDDELNVAGWTYNSSTWSYEWSGEPTTSVTLSGCNINADAITFTFGTAEAPLTVEWNASTKTGMFEMPGSDVVLTPIYAKAATFATTGTGTEATPLQPAAAEGVIAGTDASLIAEGTGIVAFAGTSTEVTQGTLMYAVGTSDTEAPAITDFSATVPTAKDVADDGATLYVWYYIQGADAPQGEAATLDNTFDDTEPACLTVTVLTNKFDITLNPANANTIEAGKATVTVDGAPATVTDGKLQAVKMGSEVKLEANPGYKFRKVEVKKKAAGPVTYTELKGGEVLHVGDILDFSDPNVEYLFTGYALSKLMSPYTVLRANIDGEPWEPTVTPADDGAYYVIQGKGGYYAFVYDLPATATSDGLLITINSEEGNYRYCTASVHEPNQ